MKCSMCKALLVIFVLNLKLCKFTIYSYTNTSCIGSSIELPDMCVHHKCSLHATISYELDLYLVWIPITNLINVNDTKISLL